ncbi:MAG: MFS transporter [Ruminococcaceae bacterium]|nr:MFS transporter [Oscillospiraceae bacterium]
MNWLKNEKVKHAFMIGLLCSVSYLAVYFARNILSTVTPQMLEGKGYSTEYIGSVSSAFFIFYAVGQLINGIIGDKMKARYMISFGLILAGVCNLAFPFMTPSSLSALVVYGLTGFFLSMIYGPMTKVVAENTEPVYATRCSLGYTFASFFGSPLAGLVASFLAWRSVFTVSSVALFVMGTVCFLIFLYFEKKGIVKYNQYQREQKKGGSIKVLIQHRIIKFTLISILTGVIRTTVVFWLPTYISQYLRFSSEQAASVFTAATLVISLTTFIAVFLYERLHHNMDVTILIGFSFSAVSFLLVFLVKQPVLNIIFMVLAIMANNTAATMLWSRYCPSLRDTGMVSGATGFLDFVSYASAAISSSLFANAVADIGWNPLILIWFGLMVVGVMVSLPRKKEMKSSR